MSAEVPNVGTSEWDVSGLPATGYHPRAVANRFVQEASTLQLPVTHMALQKLLYYSHGWHLAACELPLVRGGFQAWKDGPVSRAVYSAYKKFGTRPISSLATVIDINSGSEVIAEARFIEQQVSLLRGVLRAYGHLHAFDLRNRTHEKGSPWHIVWHSEGVVPGMAIPDHLILAHFVDHRFGTRN